MYSFFPSFFGLISMRLLLLLLLLTHISKWLHLHAIFLF